MSSDKYLIAIGRSRYLYDSINYLVSKGFAFKAIVTEEAYEEYEVKCKDFENLAANLGASFFITKELNDESIVSIIKRDNIKIGISANWKFTVPESFINLFKGGILNFHLGNLPDYKGNATVNWSIINGLKHIYANIHKMDSDLDAGNVISRKSIPITSETYISEIIKEAEMVAPLLYEEAVNRIRKNSEDYLIKGSIRGSRCYPRLPEDSQINWNLSAETISRLIRASSHPYSGAFSFLNGQKVTIWKARPIQIRDAFFAIPGHVVELKKAEGTVVVACSDGLLELQEISLNGQTISPPGLIKSIRVRFKYIPNDGK